VSNGFPNVEISFDRSLSSLLQGPDVEKVSKEKEIVFGSKRQRKGFLVESRPDARVDGTHKSNSLKPEDGF
jgi:hypothetical protein